MHAAVYRGASVVAVEEIPTPEIGTGEILIRVEACGICHTDLKKIEHNLLALPGVRSRNRRRSGRGRAASPGFSPATAWSPSITFPAANASTAGVRYTLSAPHIRRLGSAAGFEPAGADSPSTCGSWTGSWSTAWNEFLTAFHSNRPRWSSLSTLASKPWFSAIPSRTISS
jgi:hypothetical protein